MVLNLLFRTTLFLNILTYIERSWLKSQYQLEQFPGESLVIEKVKIENETNSWTFPDNIENSSKVQISSEASLKGLTYEAMIVRGKFLETLFKSESEKLLASGIIYFQLVEQVQRYNVSLELMVMDPDVFLSGNESSQCMTLEPVSDHQSQWQSGFCHLVTASTLNIQCFCPAAGPNLSNFAGFVSVGALLPVFDDSTTPETTTTLMTEPIQDEDIETTEIPSTTQNGLLSTASKLSTPR